MSHNTFYYTEVTDFNDTMFMLYCKERKGPAVFSLCVYNESIVCTGQNPVFADLILTFSSGQQVAAVITGYSTSLSLKNKFFSCPGNKKHLETHD